MYAPGLGFLMLAVGINLRLECFREVFKRPKVHQAHCLLANGCVHCHPCHLLKGLSGRQADTLAACTRTCPVLVQSC